MSQKTKVNKFLAGAVTATMVATAVAPTAALAAQATDLDKLSAEDKAYVEKAIELGYFEDAEKFNPYTPLPRRQAAFTLAREIAGSEAGAFKAYVEANDLESKHTPFKDIPASFKDENEYKAELYYASLIMKDAGAFTQENFNASGIVTRAQMAKMVVNVFDLKDNGKEVNITDLNKIKNEQDREFVKIAAQHGLTTVSEFKPNNRLVRSQMAKFLVKGYEAANGEQTPEVPSTDGITSVKAINDTRYEVTFGKAIDKDIAREISKEPNRFVAYHGGQTANTADILKADYVSFNDDYTKAEIVLNAVPATDINYTVALLDSEENTTANIVSKSKLTVLKATAAQPELTVNADQDKFILDFKTKMKDSAKNLENYTIFDDRGNVIASFNPSGKSDNLLAYAAADSYDGDALKTSIPEAKWVDSTTKKAIEFKLAPGKLDAGKTYRVVVGKNVLTDDGDQLSDSQKIINVKTPTIDKARPEAKLARVSGDLEITVVFDKDLQEIADDTTNFNKLINVKTPTGKSVQVNSVKAKAGSRELVITLDDANLEEGKLDKDVTYSVDIPENMTANNIFQNATNKAKTNLKAKTQEAIAIASMTAKFERQVDNKDKANLLLTFDQRVDLEKTKSALQAGLKIQEAGKEYTIQKTDFEVEYDVSDMEGKTIRIKDVTSIFGESAAGDFDPEIDKTYTVVAAADTIYTDSLDEVANKRELKATISGIDVSAPTIDNIELVSADKIVVEFDKDIANTIKPSDVFVQGYKLEKAGEFSEVELLNDEHYLKVSATGKKLTITTADSNTKFVTGMTEGFADEDFLRIKAEKVKGKNEVEQEKVIKATWNTDGSVDIYHEDSLDAQSANQVSDADFEFVDNAAPIMIGATVKGQAKGTEDASAIEITFSEDVESKGEDSKALAEQFAFLNTEIKNYAVANGEVENNVVTITFGDAGTDVEKVLNAKAYPKLEINYRAHVSYELKDASSNKVKNATLKGARNSK